jgi:polysaccharide transporter, PST family
VSAPAIASAESLRARVLSGLAWKATSQIVTQCARAVAGILLARLLAPHDYGLAAMVVVFSSFVLVFSDLSLGAALVQRRALTEDDRSTVFWTSLAAGACFTLAGFAVAGPVAAFYGQPAVRPLFEALSIAFFVTSLATTQNALLQRELAFRRLELCTMTSAVGGAIVGIVIAVRGGGAWAIIGQQLAVAVISTALLWRLSPWRPSLRFSRSSLRALGGFSGNVFGQRLLYYLMRNVDNVLVGRFLGPAALGAYGLAYTVMLAPFSQIGGPVQEVLFPAFSRMQDDRERMAEVWVRASRVVGSLAIPALLGLIVVAPDFVDVVLGRRWRVAVPVIQILSWAGLLQSLQRLNGDILQALDRTQLLLRYSIASFAVNLVAFVVGLQWGIRGVAAAFAIAATVVEPAYAWLTARALGTTVRRFAGGFAGVAQASVAMALGVLAARLLLLRAGLSAPERLAALVLIGVVLYVPLCALRSPELAAELRRLLRRRAAA